MSILIGIKKEHAHGSYNSEDGYGGFSINTNSVVVIKEGKKSDLVDYVHKMRAGEANARRLRNHLEDSLEFSGLSEKEYEKRSDTYDKMLYLSRFDKLMIVEGELI